MNVIRRQFTKLRMRDFLIILLGTTLISIDVKYVLDPAGLVTGGVSGLAIVLLHARQLACEVEDEIGV